jgi:hypothetical protein
MTRPQQHPDGPRDNQTRIALAALTGATRVVTDWLINHFSV